MCYEYDEYFQQALIAEQMRARKKIADEAAKPTAAPSKPAEPEKRKEEKEPVPA